MISRLEEFKRLLEDEMHYPMMFFEQDGLLKDFYYTLYSAYAYIYCSEGSVNEASFTRYLVEMTDFFCNAHTACYNDYHCAELKQHQHILFPWFLAMACRTEELTDAEALIISFSPLKWPGMMKQLLEYFANHIDEDMRAYENSRKA